MLMTIPSSVALGHARKGTNNEIAAVEERGPMTAFLRGGAEFEVTPLTKTEALKPKAETRPRHKFQLL